MLAGAFDELYGIVDAPMLRRGRITRRDLLLSVADLERADRVDRRGGRARGLRAAHDRSAEVQLPLDLAGPADVGDVVATGLPELTATERLAAELDIIGLDASRHVLSGHLDFLAALGVTSLLRPAHPAEPQGRADRRGEGGHPDPTGPLRAPGGLPHPRRHHRAG